ncbi:ankyrin repeat-containing protein NPR4-like [Argentina anserina]|uniref:ankyrin repeat-containing protein NPR4-like n=1 Tax=Argentina anserina TaxID=57926 RepID=UPI0021767526|nr:ankyrin repeat-containing protein NPR4-like [Potentilla anserina]
MNPSDTSEMTEISNPTSGYHATRLEETDVVFCSEWNRQKSKPVTNSISPVTRRISSMDTTVFNAAQECNIDALREHSGQLHQMLTPTKNTVLHVHIACVGSERLTKPEELLKSAEVVREMLKMCQPLLLQPNQSGDTALHLAARYGHADIVGVLIQAAKDWRGDLEEGISSNELCHQCLIRSTNEEKNTALHEAVQFNHQDVVKILTREDPEFIYSANDAGETPLYMAAERRYRKLVFDILNTCTSPSYQGPNGLTALHMAAIHGDEEITRRLLEKEMTLAVAEDVYGWTPLHMAAFGGHVSIVKQILECDKSTVYIGDNDKMTPVHHAAKDGRVDVLRQLRLYCPDSFELTDVKGRNALHHAILANKGKVEEFVRVDPWLSSILLNGKDFEGNTPLHQIAISEKYDGLRFISDDRVDKMAFNNNNKNALSIIAGKTNSQWKTNLQQALITDGANVSLRVLSKANGAKNVDVNKGDGGVKQAYVNNLDNGGGESNYKEIKESHLVVSTLIATVTFAAGFTVPGGYQSEKGPDQGFAILSRNAAFQAFVITNTLAMTMSSCAVLIRFFIPLQRREFTFGTVPFGTAIFLTMYALVAMVVAFLTGTYAVLGGHSSFGLAIAALVVGCFFFFALAAFVFFPAFASLRTSMGEAHDCIFSVFENLCRGNLSMS